MKPTEEKTRRWIVKLFSCTVEFLVVDSVLLLWFFFACLCVCVYHHINFVLSTGNCVLPGVAAYSMIPLCFSSNILFTVQPSATSSSSTQLYCRIAETHVACDWVLFYTYSLSLSLILSFSHSFVVSFDLAHILAFWKLFFARTFVTLSHTWCTPLFITTSIFIFTWNCFACKIFVMRQMKCHVPEQWLYTHLHVCQLQL